MPSATAKGEGRGPVTLEKGKISLDLKGIDINDLFKILSLEMGISIVPSKGISGRLNFLINNLSFEDALDLIVLSQDLACERNGKVIKVMTAAEYEKLYGRKYNEKRQFKAVKLGYAKPSAIFATLGQLKSDIGKLILDEPSATILLMDTPEKIALMEEAIKELDQPVETGIFHLEYAKPEDIKTQLSSIITAGVGEVIVDQRSNKVIVSDLPDKMKKIRRIIKEFDAENPQVLVETQIVEITLKNEYQRQINWEAIVSKLHDLDLVGTFPVSASFTPSLALSVASQLISVGSLAKDKYTATLKFLETFGDTKIVSQPALLAVNNQEAKILVGSREAYVLQTLSQAAGSTISAEDIQFIDVGVKLNVVPTINNDGFITMKIKSQVSSVRETITTTLGSRVPIVDTSEVEAVVKVKDGTMIMIAGLFKQEKRKDITGVPGISRLPFLGQFFGARAELKKRVEMIVFLTPHIVRGDKDIRAAAFKGSASEDYLAELAPSPEPSAVPQQAKLEMDIQDKLKGMKVLTSR